MFTFSLVKRSTLTVGVVSLIGLSTICVSEPSHAQVINGSFETGAFPPFLTTGDATIQTSAFGSGPTQGTFQALITNGLSSVPVADLETFLELTPGSIYNPGSIDRGATEGSAFRQTFLANAGDTLLFEFNFLTNEDTPSIFNGFLAFNDFSFVTLDGNVIPLADTTSTPFSTSPTVFNQETGFRSIAFPISTTGTFTLGFGVVDDTGFVFDSGLLVDNISIQPIRSPSPSPSPSPLLPPSPEPEPIPEPSSIILGLLIFGAFCTGAILKRQRRKCQS